MRSPPTVLACALLLSGCSALLRAALPDREVPPELRFPTLRAPVSVRVDELGVPLVEAADPDDLAFGLGFTAARDRLGQMVSIKLMALGRVGELLGPAMLDTDRFMRAMDLPRAARALWEGSSPRTRRLLQRYAAGVNAYLDLGHLPPDLQLAGYRPERWTPRDSLLVFALINFGLQQNLQEEIGALVLAQAVGVEKLAWLHPIYPDEPLPFEEAKKLAGIDLETIAADVAPTQAALAHLRSAGIVAGAASNNWAVHKSRTRGGASILANDTHLPISLPSIWHFVHARSPTYDAAGVAIAGVPGVVAGYNGHVAWGMTMVEGDGQDVFLEKLEVVDGHLHYRHGDAWVPCEERIEVFHLKGRAPVVETAYATRHGPLLNASLRHSPKHLAIPPRVESGLGIALQMAMFEPDASVDAFLALGQARSVEEAAPVVRRIRAIPVNVVFADRDNIAWQVTGRYPLRGKGLGLLPSPGWTGEYDWQGFLDPAEHPAKVNPPEGFLATANNRTVPPPQSSRLSSAWYSPDRIERAEQLLARSGRGQTAHDSRQMQLDRHSPLAGKLRALITTEPFGPALAAAIARLPPVEARRAQEALAMLKGFDGELAPDSRAAAVYGAFFHCAGLRAFADELGPAGGELWRTFVTVNDSSYGARDDHLLVRGDESPFWDDVRTPGKETKADVFALALSDAVALLEARLGGDRARWAWGALHTYHWRTEGSRMGPTLSWPQRLGMWAASRYFDRGPFPAGGDHTTLNAAAFRAGIDFDTWLIPEMRLVVDFSSDEPMVGINSSGQSGHPSSAHYDDGIEAWLAGRYHPFPFRAENIDGQYRAGFRLVPGREEVPKQEHFLW